MRRLLFIFAISAAAFGQGVSFSSVNVPGSLLAGSCSGDAARMRTVPAGLPSLPMLPTCVWAPGDATVNTTVDAAFKAKYPAVLAGGFAIVNQSTGNDSTCAVNTTKACATLQKASSIASIVYVTSKNYVGSGSKPLIDKRWTDTLGTSPTLFVCTVPPCTLSVFGDTIANNTWSATGGHANTYQTAIASAAGGTSGKLNKVLYQDGTVDAYGFPARLATATPNAWGANITYGVGQYVTGSNLLCYQATVGNVNQSPPNASYWQTCPSGFDGAGLANLDLLATGWYFSTANTLYVKLNGLDLTSPTNAAKIRASYWQQGNNQARIFVDGTVVALEGFYLDGVMVLMSQLFDGVNYRSPEVWEQNLTIFAAPGYGTQVRGGDVYAQNVVAHANTQDGWNADLGLDSATGSPHVSLMELVNSWGHGNGDSQTYLTGGVLPGVYPNLNGASSHNGYAAYISSVFENNLGPEIADTSNTGSSPVIPSITWVVGSTARNADAIAASIGNVAGFFMGGVVGSSVGDARNRKFYLDTVSVYNENNKPVDAESNAACNTFSLVSDQPVFFSPAGTCRSYMPEAP